MKILIIGAAGFIGEACVHYFSKKNETTGFDCVGQRSKNMVIDKDFMPLHQLVSQKFDAIINCAGSSDISDSFVNTGKDFQLNVLFIQQILESIKTTSPLTKIINLSSAAVYGNPKHLPIKEESLLLPCSPYGFHKLLSEQIMREYAKFNNLKTLSLRIFSAYGPGLKRQFFYDLYNKFRSRESEIELSGTGYESRDFIFILDIMQAIDVLLKNAQFNGEVYNIACQEETFIEAAAMLFANICGYTGKIKFSQEQLKGYPLNWKADISKLKSLGFSAETKLEEGLTLYYKWITALK